MKYWFSTLALTVVLTSGAFAGNPEIAPAPSSSEAHDLTLGNFFTAGWDQSYSHRESAPDSAIDLPLFHATTNYLARCSRTDFYFQNTTVKSGLKNVAYLDEYLDYALNNRLMITAFGNYTWINHETGPNVDGAGAGVMARLQLVDTAASSSSFNFRLDTPDRDLGVHSTGLTTSLNSWQDLTPLGARKFEVFYAIGNQTLAGLQEAGKSRDNLTYDIALGRTWTNASAPIGKLTTLVEFSGVTQLTGDHRGLSTLTLTPAVEFALARRNLIMLGLDVPASHPATYRDTFRVTYLYSF